MKSWVDFGATQWFSTTDPWIGNPAPQPLGMNENENQINNLTTIMNKNQVYFHLFVFISTLITSPCDQIPNVKLPM